MRGKCPLLRLWRLLSPAFSDNLPTIVSRYLELESVAQDIRSPAPRDRCGHGAPRHRAKPFLSFGSIRPTIRFARRPSHFVLSADPQNRALAGAPEHGPLGRQR